MKERNEKIVVAASLGMSGLMLLMLTYLVLNLYKARKVIDYIHQRVNKIL